MNNKEEIKRNSDGTAQNIPKLEHMSEEEKERRIAHNVRILTEEIFIPDREFEEELEVKMLGENQSISRDDIAEDYDFDYLVRYILIASERLQAIDYFRDFFDEELDDIIDDAENKFDYYSDDEMTEISYDEYKHRVLFTVNHLKYLFEQACECSIGLDIDDITEDNVVDIFVEEINDRLSRYRNEMEEVLFGIYERLEEVKINIRGANSPLYDVY